MNKHWKIVLIAATLFLLAAICLLLFRKKDNQLLLKVPAESTSVMVIDARTLSAKLFLDDIGREPKSSKRIADLLPDSLKNIDWEENGLSLFDKIVLFTREDTASGNISANFIIQISNARKFNLFMDTLARRLKFTIDKKHGVNVAWCKIISLLAAWDDKFVTGSKVIENDDRNLELLIKTLSTPKEHSILTDTCFAKRLDDHYDAMLYTKPYQKCLLKKLELINSNMGAMVSYMNFNDGILEINTELKTKRGSALDRAFVKTDRDMPVLANNDSAIVNIMLNVEAASSRQLFKDYKLFDFKTTGIPYHEAWDGRVNLAFNSSKTIEIEYTTYEYDDNFNKIAAKKVRQDKIYDLQAIAGINNKVLDSLFKLYPPVRTEKDTLLLKGSNFVLTKAGTCYVAHNKYFCKPSTAHRVTKNYVEIEANYKKLISVLNEAGFDTPNWLNNNTCERISLKASKTENINISSSLSFKDKKKNSFYSIMESFNCKFNSKR